MKLFEHADFEQAVVRASEHLGGRGLRPALIEKDYYVTEALRTIATIAGDTVIGKGVKAGDHRTKAVLTCDEIKAPVVKEESTTIY